MTTVHNLTFTTKIKMLQVPSHLLFFVYYYYYFGTNRCIRRPCNNNVSEDNDDFLFLSQALKYKEGKPYIHSRYRKVFYRGLSRASKRLRDRRIPRVALQDPSRSAWNKLYTSNSDQALITLTGLNHPTFGWLLYEFDTLFKKYTPFGTNGMIMRLGMK